jgi:hypothetical protein
MVSMLKRRFLACLIVLVSVVLLLPSTALAYNWRSSPRNPLVVGGVHSKAEFKHLFLYHKKVNSAVKGVLAVDHAPSWVYGAALAQVKAGAIHSGTLPHGTKLGAMAYGRHTTRIVNNTVWTGHKSLAYYWVNATRSVVVDGVRVDTTYRVALAKPCCNPFVLGPFVTRTPVVVPTYNLYIEKREGSVDGNLLAEWNVTGTVGGAAVNKWTLNAPVLVGSYPAGTAYDLQEVIPVESSWYAVSPTDGRFVGVMPAQDLTLTFVNAQRQIP